MNHSNSEISQYYSFKDDSYQRKYNHGYFTHVHPGLYPRKSFPYLFEENFDLKTLGLNRIKYLLFRGQELLSLKVIEHLAVKPQSRILDGGCGYAATSILCTQNTGPDTRITAVSLSGKQLEVCKTFIEESGKSDQISTELVNIFDFESSEPLDRIFSIDASCQMGDYPRLFQKFYEILGQNGKVVISDHFIKDVHQEKTKNYFDDYWKSDISSIQQLVDGALSAGFTISLLKNITQEQIPFWRLSKSHSEIMLTKDTPDAERKRLNDSKDFHEFLLDCYRSNAMQYFHIILEK